MHKKETTTAENLHNINELLKLPEYKLFDGFGMAYFALLKSIEERNFTELGTFCERNLSRSFSEGFEDINNQIERIELLNAD